MTEGACLPPRTGKVCPDKLPGFPDGCIFPVPYRAVPFRSPPHGKKGGKQYEHQQFHLAILLNILSASSSVFCSCRLLNTSSAPRSDLFFSLYRKCRPPFLSWISMTSLFLSGMVNLFMATVNIRLSCAGISSG